MQQLRTVFNYTLVIAITILLGYHLVPSPQPAYAQNNSFSLTDQMVDYMADEGKRARSFRFSNLKFKDGESDLYLTLFNEIALEGDRSARRSVAQSRNINRDDILQEFEEPDELIEEYEQERQFFEMLAKHENETLALEMFSNGSTRDADFDLLDDLYKIEKILFGTETESQFGPSLNRNRPSTENFLTQEFTTSDSNLITGTNPAETPIQINNDICQVDNSLVENLNEYEDTAAAERTASEDTATPEESTRKALRQLQPNDPSCGSNFCLRIERIYETRSAYFAEDLSCIGCIVEDMANTTDELLSKSLTPNKITGNFGEPNICKESFGLNVISMRISLIQRPLAPDESTNTVNELSPTQVQDDDRVQSSTTVDPATDTVGQALDKAASLQVVGQEDFADKASQVETENQLNLQIRDNLSQVVQDINSNAALAGALNQRMQTMTTYFESYQDMLAEIQGTLYDVTQKDQCSNL